tara:strand:+ start:1478 stop:1750 length:273 start_codon:yes stop_codon:yes gene_type:complete
MAERYIDINGSADIIDFPVNPSRERINDWIRDYLRYQGDFSANLRPVEASDPVYGVNNAPPEEQDYLEIRIVIGRKPEFEDGEDGEDGEW